MAAITEAAKRRRSERAWVYITRERKSKLRRDAQTLEERFTDKFPYKISMARLASQLLGDAIDSFRP